MYTYIKCIYIYILYIYHMFCVLEGEWGASDTEQRNIGKKILFFF